MSGALNHTWGRLSSLPAGFRPADRAEARRQPERAAPDAPALGGFLWLAGAAAATGSVVQFEPAPYDLSVAVLLAAGILSRRLGFRPEHRLPAALLAGVLAVQALLLPNALDLAEGIRFVAIDVFMILSWFFVCGVGTAYGTRGAVVLTNGYIVAGLAAALVSVLAFTGVIPGQTPFLRYGRAQGFFKDPNVYGPYLVPALLFLVGRLERLRLLSWKLAGSLAACALLGAGLFLSFSRAAWLNSVAAFSSYFIIRFVADLRRRTVPWRLVASLAALLLAGGTVLAIALQGNSHTARLLAIRLGKGGLQNYDAMRFYTHDRAVASVMENPAGLGPGQSEIAFEYATHNMYLRILSESGVAGFVLLYGFLLLSFLRSARAAVIAADSSQRDTFAAVAAALAGICVNGLVIDTFHWRHFWFLLGLAWWAPAQDGGQPAGEPFPAGRLEAAPRSYLVRAESKS